ncbi:hypothetical protein [Pseudomarimonas arenosa]|uniref:Uncharacterized protein n=1 Tax=Pseudomarimonas arenosa TaxID=2774145 RepID=A0AAW3ZHD7_9GAMM|nr:hypothetical protein [Pseudomarimonas arenosa]MBD8524532.1 hypothetical protein [Pseudomarimonas arenosa]
MSATRKHALAFAALALVMVLTRIHHFGPIPDASWAVFFGAGFWMGRAWRWAFPSLMLVAVTVDYFVITASGQNFFSHYCVSPGYWMLLPAHAAMWAGGRLLALRAQRPAWQRGLELLVVVPAAVALCHLFAQGGFYWLSDVVAEPTVAGWAKNYADWFLPYLKVAAIYIGLAALGQASVEALSGQSLRADRTAG